MPLSDRFDGLHAKPSSDAIVSQSYPRVVKNYAYVSSGGMYKDSDEVSFHGVKAS